MDQFESLFSYVGLGAYYGLNLSELINSIRNNSSSKYDAIRADDHIGRNQTPFDLGLSPSIFDDYQAVDHMIISKLEKEFHLEMTTERMEEFLILLRHLLCLSIEDITSLAINARNPEHIIELNPEERKVLRTWLAADERI